MFPKRRFYTEMKNARWYAGIFLVGVIGKVVLIFYCDGYSGELMLNDAAYKIKDEWSVASKAQ